MQTSYIIRFENTILPTDSEQMNQLNSSIKLITLIKNMTLI